MRLRSTLCPCDRFVDSNSDQILANRSVGELARLFFNYYYLMVENLQGCDSTAALSPLPRKKAKTQIRCDRPIAACCGCLRKQDRFCLSDEKCSGGRQTRLWDSGGGRGERERWERRRVVQKENETAKCWTVSCDLLQIDFCKLAPFFLEKWKVMTVAFWL